MSCPSMLEECKYGTTENFSMGFRNSWFPNIVVRYESIHGLHQILKLLRELSLTKIAGQIQIYWSY